MNRKKYRLAAAAVSALAIAALGMGAPAAFADVGDPYKVNAVNQENPSNTALVNPAGDVQLSIHKYLGANLLDTNNMPIYGDGTVTTITGKDALQGVQFDVYQVYTDSAKTVPVNLTTNDGWAAASAITGYTLTQANITAGNFTIGTTTYYLGTATPVTTTSSGTATFTKADGVGLYLVNENVPASTSVINLTTGLPVPTSSITPTAPFFVTLPMTNPDEPSRWMYDVNVYPKNQSDYINLAVVDMGTQTTDDSNGPASNRLVDYVLTSSIPDGTVPLGQYVIQQDLDPTLTPTGVVDVVVGGVTLAPGTDYVVWYAANANTAAVPYVAGTPLPPGAVVTVVFTDTGLAYLEAHRDAEVVTTIHTTLGLQDTVDGIVPAQASLVPNEAWWDQNYPGSMIDPETPNTTPPGAVLIGIDSNMVESKYGDLRITKTDAQSATTLLAGAEFTLYKDADNSETCTATDAVAANVIGGPLATDANGVLVWDGLQTSDFYNGKAAVDPDGAGPLTGLITYCLVETKAPTGYNLLAEPVAFTILSTNTGMITALPLVNEKSNLGNNLPLTGGEGIAALSLGGLLLIGGGAGYYVYTSRKRRTA